MRTHSLGYRIPSHIPGTINGLVFGSYCAKGNAGSEDCLFLNIFAPFLPESTECKKLKPSFSGYTEAVLQAAREAMESTTNETWLVAVMLLSQSTTGGYFLSISIPNY